MTFYQDKYNDDLLRQALIRSDQATVGVAVKHCVLMTDKSTEKKDVGVHVFWRPPLEYGVPTAKGTRTLRDERGVLNSLGTFRVQFRNLLNAPIEIECNTPKSSPYFASSTSDFTTAVATRSGHTLMRIPPGGIKTFTMTWNNANFGPSITKTQVKNPFFNSADVGYSKPHIILPFVAMCSHVAYIPSQNLSTGAAYAEAVEAYEMTLSFNYTAEVLGTTTVDKDASPAIFATATMKNGLDDLYFVDDYAVTGADAYQLKKVLRGNDLALSKTDLVAYCKDAGTNKATRVGYTFAYSSGEKVPQYGEKKVDLKNTGYALNVVAVGCLAGSSYAYGIFPAPYDAMVPKPPEDGTFFHWIQGPVKCMGDYGGIAHAYYGMSSSTWRYSAKFDSLVLWDMHTDAPMVYDQWPYEQSFAAAEHGQTPILPLSKPEDEDFKRTLVVPTMDTPRQLRVDIAIGSIVAVLGVAVEILGIVHKAISGISKSLGGSNKAKGKIVVKKKNPNQQPSLKTPNNPRGDMGLAGLPSPRRDAIKTKRP